MSGLVDFALSPADWAYLVAWIAFVFMHISTNWSKVVVSKLYDYFTYEDKKSTGNSQTFAVGYGVGFMWFALFTIIALTSWNVQRDNAFYEGIVDAPTTPDTSQRNDYQWALVSSLVTVASLHLWVEVFFGGIHLLTKSQYGFGAAFLGLAVLFNAVALSFSIVFIAHTFGNGHDAEAILWIVLAAVLLVALVVTLVRIFYFYCTTDKSWSRTTITERHTIKRTSSKPRPKRDPSIQSLLR